MKAFTIFTILILILIALQFFDLYTSLINIENKGLMEVNPLSRYILGNYGIVAYSLVKIFLNPLIFFMIFITLKTRPENFKPWFNVVVLVIVLVYAGVVSWNFLLP